MLTAASQIAQRIRTPGCLTSPESIVRGGSRVRTLLFVATGAAVVAATVASAALAVGMPGQGHARVTRADLQGVNFVENCAFSHRAPDDPIVFPGKPGLSHDHSFVGNESTDAFSTFAT